MKNKTESTINTTGAIFKSSFLDRIMDPKEKNFLWEIIKTCDFSRDNEIPVNEEMLLQAQFDADSEHLGLSKKQRFVFNRICCLLLGIRHSFFDYKTLINKLLDTYTIGSLYGIFRHFEARYMEHCDRFDIAGNVSLTHFELPLSSYTYVDNELILYVEEWLDFSESKSRDWDKIWHIYNCSLESLVPVDFKSTSIAKACKRLLGTSQKKLEKYFGGTAFWLAVKCILSHKLRLKQAHIQALFSSENYFAAKAFIAIYPTMKTSQKRRFVIKDKYDKTAYMLQVLMNSKAQSKLFAEYLNASALILNQR